MPFDPEYAVAEVLGKPVKKGYNPASDDYMCPFINSPCVKRSAKLDDPYPVCSVWRGKGDGARTPEELVCVCPKRFYAVNFLKDVVAHCWPDKEAPANPHIAPEVQMKGFGNVDFVIVDVREDGSINQFLSVELLAIDITGSVRGAYDALLKGESMSRRPTYGLNWKNVYKRYITQLIGKGYFHHHWDTKIVAVIQDQVYQYIRNEADFMRSRDIRDSSVNIIFMTYAFEDDPASPGYYKPVLRTVEGTSHSSLQNAVLYKQAPKREEFCKQIMHRLNGKSALFKG